MGDKTEKKARALGINHVVLEVGDLDAALKFYGAISILRFVEKLSTTLSLISATSSCN